MSERALAHSATASEFLEKAAGREPTPGGGGIAALSGAAAAAMAEMALNFTVGNKRFAEVAEEAAGLLEMVRAERLRLTELIAADAAGYAKVAAALKMPKKSDEEKAARKKALAAAMREGLEPPLAMVRSIVKIAGEVSRIERISNPNLSGDVAVAAALLPAAARAASLNVWANITALESGRAEEVAAEVAGALDEIEKSCSRVYQKIEGELCPKGKAASS